jgi:hypothetical protein
MVRGMPGGEFAAYGRAPYTISVPYWFCIVLGKNHGRAPHKTYHHHQPDFYLLLHVPSFSGAYFMQESKKRTT